MVKPGETFYRVVEPHTNAAAPAARDDVTPAAPPASPEPDPGNTEPVR